MTTKTTTIDGVQVEEIEETILEKYERRKKEREKEEDREMSEINERYERRNREREEEYKKKMKAIDLYVQKTWIFLGISLLIFFICMFLLFWWFTATCERDNENFNKMIHNRQQYQQQIENQNK